MSSVIPCVDNFNSYMNSINRFPLLSLDEEINAGRRYRDHNDLDAAKTLIVSHLRIVVKIAKGFLGYGLPIEDMIQEGNIGLMQAVKRFDPERGIRLVSYAIQWIRYSIQEYIVQNWRLVKIASTAGQRKLFFNLRSLKTSLAPLSQKQIKDIAIELNVTEKDVVYMEGRFSNQEVSIDKQSSDESNSESDEYQKIYLKSDSNHEPYNIMDMSQEMETLENMIDRLDDRSRRIIETRLLCDDEDKLTLMDLSKEFGVSQERIRQIELSALNKLRSYYNVSSKLLK